MTRSAGQLAGKLDSVLVCGAGAAGLAAALAAAATGATVHLIESSRHVGGTVVAALIHTLAGLHDSAGRLINEGLPRQLVQRLTRADARVGPRRIGRAWVLSVCPTIYQAVVEEWIAAEPRISVLTGTQVVEVHREAERVVGVGLSGPNGSWRLRPGSIVDATGTAEVIRSIDPMLVEDGPPATAGGLILRVRGVAPTAVRFPQNLAALRAIREAAADGRLPSSCAQLWIDQGFYEDEAFIKLSVSLGQNWRERRSQIEQDARQAQLPLLHFMQQLPGFARARLVQSGAIGIREGGRIRGDYRLTGDDVRALRRFPDAACRCAWPIEYWHPQRGVSLEYLPQGGYYEVPMQSLRPRGLRNVWAAGKCLSADPEAQASARVAGCCWAMGEAVGRASAAG